jgi:hypothetical protein
MAFEELKVNTINAYAKYIATYPETPQMFEYLRKIAKLQKSVTWLVSPNISKSIWLLILLERGYYWYMT